MDWIALIAGLAVGQYIIVTSIAGAARGKFGVPAPATTGNEQFERRYRVQQNTLEQLVAFLPSLYLCAMYASQPLAIFAGVIYLLGRCHYAYSYIKDPKLRAPGMLMTFFSTATMAVAALAGIVWTLVGGGGT